MPSSSRFLDTALVIEGSPWVCSTTPDWTRQRRAGSFARWLNLPRENRPCPGDESSNAEERFEGTTDALRGTHPRQVPPALAVEQIRYGQREYRVNSAGQLEVAEVRRQRPWGLKIADRLGRMFLPEGYPDSVGPDYAEYTKWRGRAFFFGGMVGVFSTQSLLLAVGVGRPSAAPIAAALQWVIRDGLGRAGRMLFSQVGTGFDAETKQYRLAAAFVLNVSCALETLTPFFPDLFLPLASVANMAKGASTIAAASTRGAIYRSFMRRENLGDITAKQETVGVVGDLLGTAVGVVLARVASHSHRLSMIAFGGASLGHLVSAYYEVKSVELRTLNRQRAHMLIWSYLEENGTVLPIKTVNRRERLIYRPWLDSLHAPNVELGARLSDAASNAESLRYLLRLYHDEKYMLTYAGGRVRIVLRQDATHQDQLKAYFQSRAFWRLYKSSGDRFSPNRTLIEESYRVTNRLFPTFIHDCRTAGWNVDCVLLRPIARRVQWD
ncbi:hypothetical protein CCYA_CCYA11G3133 [Cyanidiococcus yangmingshanensis]|nr:hypothetical protein CCYA_CCYA11G3133 [Cyanidiococcus yangmingshanensis]